MSRSPLAGKRVLVTRPAAQAQGLATLIREAGGAALCIPAIEIREIAESAEFSAVAGALETFHLAVFVSPNAVQRGLHLLRTHGVQVPWTKGPRVAALGQGSRRALEESGFRDVVAPAGLPDSEALLALPELAEVAGKRVALFRGEGGRDLLGSTLAARRALVTSAVCYRRSRPESSRAPLVKALARGVDAVVVTSIEGLGNLFELAGADGAVRLARAPLFVPHARVRAAAAGRGVRQPIVADPRDAQMLAALVAYFGVAG